MVINIHDKVFHILEVVNKKKKSSKKKKKLKHQLKLNLLLLLFEEWGAGYCTSQNGTVRRIEADLNSDGSASSVVVTCEGTQGICWIIDGNNLLVDPVVPGPGGTSNSIYAN